MSQRRAYAWRPLTQQALGKDIGNIAVVGLGKGQVNIRKDGVVVKWEKAIGRRCGLRWHWC